MIEPGEIKKPAKNIDPLEKSLLDEELGRARLFRNLCWLGFALAITTLVMLIIFNLNQKHAQWEEVWLIGVIAAFFLIVLTLNIIKRLKTAALILITGSIIITSFLIYRWEGVYAPYPIYYIICILVAAVFINIRVSIIVAIVCIIIYSSIILGQFAGWLPTPARFSFTNITIIGLLGRNASFIAVALLAQLFMRLLATRGRIVADSERRYRELVENAPDMIISFDKNGIAVEANRRACEVLGYGRGELIGKPGQALVRPEERDTLAAYFTSLMKTGAPKMIEIEMMDSEGHPIPVEVNHTLIVESGEAIGLRAIIRDISARNRMLEEQNKLREQLILSEKLAGLGQLVLGISHEFNNILAGLRGMAEVARIPGRQTSLTELPGKIIILVDRAHEVTRSLLGFAQRFEPSISRVRLLDIFEDVLRLTETQLEMNHIIVDINVPEDLAVFTEAGKLQEVLLNLVINAQQAMKEGGTLKISAGSDVKFVKIAISDTGTGISPENIKRIFDPFFTTKGAIGGSDQPGTGLGLSLSYGIVQSLHGDIDVESETGKGSTFTVLLPNRKPDFILEEKEKPSEEPAKKKDEEEFRRILVIEDEPAIRETLVEFLEASGQKATGASDGEEGLKALDRERFDVVFVDLFMPRLSGEEFIRLAHKKLPDLSYIIITGKEFSVTEDSPQIAQLPNIISVIRKPFSYEIALDIVKNLSAPDKK